MARRKTIDEDIDRLAENLDIAEGGTITDRDSFDLALNRYLVNSGLSTSSKDKVFDAYVRDNPSVSKDRLFKKAGGKDLKRDRKQTAKTVVKDRKEFIKRGSKRVDFAGLDTKESELRRVKRPTKEFNVSAFVKGKQVFSKRIKNKRGIIQFKDQKGRFASVK